MAHNINFNQLTGKHSFFTTREHAWHGLGQVVENCLTSEEAIVKAQLDWKVEKQILFSEYDETGGNNPPVPVIVENRYTTMRMDTKEILGIVSDRYCVVQNKEGFKFFDEIVGKGQAIFETAGVLGKGEVIFITAKLPGHIKVLNKDDIEKYLLLMMSHDGSASITATFTPIKVVCNNTLTAALEGAPNKVYVKHNGNAAYNLKMAHTLLGITAKLSDSLSEVFSAFAKVKLTETEVQKYIMKVFDIEADLQDENPTPTRLKAFEAEQNLVNTIWTYYHNGPGQAEHLGNLYGAYNAITGYLQNVKDFRTTSSKMKNLFMGEGERISLLAFRVAYAILKHKTR